MALAQGVSVAMLPCQQRAEVEVGVRLSDLVIELREQGKRGVQVCGSASVCRPRLEHAMASPRWATASACRSWMRPAAASAVA